jgi:1-acyl-sn-glycerol-3-phosphate acyltransferase
VEHAAVTRPVADLVGRAVAGFARLATGVHVDWRAAVPDTTPRVYFGNHNSHGDFVLIWSALPRAVRRRTRPVAGADYWMRSAARRFLGRDVFGAVLIERDPEKRTEDPVTQMAGALGDGASLILFPEGTRNVGTSRLQPFRTGLYHLSRTKPDVDLVPVWIDNLARVLPKGEAIPVPLLCTVTFGPPIRAGEAEDKDVFLERARQSLLALAGPEVAR